MRKKVVFNLRRPPKGLIKVPRRQRPRKGGNKKTVLQAAGGNSQTTRNNAGQAHTQRNTIIDKSYEGK